MRTVAELANRESTTARDPQAIIRRWLCRVAVLMTLPMLVAGSDRPVQVTWNFDNLQRIGSHAVTVEGRPEVVRTRIGPAIRFDGTTDSLFINGAPLVGASKFTIEVVFKPEGGAHEQRFFHIAETDPATGLDVRMGPDGDLNRRIMFEIRVVGDEWYLDAFMNNGSSNHPLIFESKRYPVNRWYAVAQSYDGATYRSYVDGALQGEYSMPFVVRGPGHVRAGARMNHKDYFHGSIAKARFTERALSPTEMLNISHGS